MTRILLADDHTLFRQGLRRLLADHPDLDLAGEAGTAEETSRLLACERWDLLVLDLSLPDHNGLDLLRRLQPRLPCPVLVLTMHPAERYAVPAFQLGARGYLSKDCSAAELLAAIRMVAAGGQYLPSHLAKRLFIHSMSKRGGVRLSRREREVLVLLAHGRTLVEIACQLGVRPKTVSTYRARLLSKLHLDNNAQLVRYALEEGLI